MSKILNVFLENEKALRRYLSRLVDTRHDVDDSVQETFLRGFASELKRDILDPKAYLFRIAKNIALEKLRKKGNFPTESTGDSDGIELIVDEQQPPIDQHLDGRLKLAVLLEAIEGLPPRCKEAFILRHVEGLQYAQIADRMQISIKAVEHHLSAGLTKCREYLCDQGYEPSEFSAAKATAKIREPQKRVVKIVDGFKSEAVIDDE